MIGRRKLLSSVTAAAIVPSRGFAQQSASVKVGLTTLDGGGYALYAPALLDALKFVDPLLQLVVVPTNGTADNAAMLATGDIDIGLVTGEVTNELLTAKVPEDEQVKVVSVMYSSPGLFAVRADSRFRRITDLRGRPIVWSVKGSGVMVQARYVIEGLGLDMERDFEPIYPEKFTQASGMVFDGRAAALWGTGARWPAFVELANSPIGARFVAPDSREIQRICAKFDFMARMTVPAGLYIGQYDPIETVGTWSFILARGGLPSAVGLRLAASLNKAERMGAMTKQLAQSTAKNTLAAVPSREALQPGVLEFYQKKGFIR
jgi:TRAP transporter TAXI family solute receptor